MESHKSRNERRKREKFKEIRQLVAQYRATTDTKQKLEITHRIFQIQSSLWKYHGMDKEVVMRQVERLLKSQ